VASALDVVIVPDFRPDLARTFEARTLFFLASWLENAGRARDFPLHVACIGEPPRSVRWLAERCDASVTVHSPVGAETRGTSNKLRGLEVDGREDSVLLLDADVLVLSDFSGLASMTGCIAAAPSARPRVPERYWSRIYPALGLPLPEERMAGLIGELDCAPGGWSDSDMRAAKSMLPYHSAGVVLSPWDSGLRTVWEDHIRRIASLFRADEPKSRTVMGSDMAAFATTVAALERQGTPFRRLPDAYNVRNLHLGVGAIAPDDAKLYHASKFGLELSSESLAIGDEPQRYEQRLREVFSSYRRPPGTSRSGDANAQAIGDTLSTLYVRHVMPALGRASGRNASTPRGPVAVGCIGGSGSRVLRDILAACPEIHMDLKVKATNKDSLGCRAFKLQRDHSSPEYRRLLKRFVESVIAQIDPADARAYRWFGFKEPKLIWHAGPLMDMYPGSRFVHLIRDPRTVLPGTASHGRFLRERSDPEDDEMSFLLDEWAEANLSVWRAYRESPRYRLVRYEELVTSPERTIRSLLAWLEVSDAALPEACAIVDPPPDALSRGRAIDISRISAEVQELGYG
jgi:Sulfotransferase family